VPAAFADELRFIHQRNDVFNIQVTGTTRKGTHFVITSMMVFSFGAH
jgi:hypothetical protein